MQEKLSRQRIVFAMAGGWERIGAFLQTNYINVWKNEKQK